MTMNTQGTLSEVCAIARRDCFYTRLNKSLTNCWGKAWVRGGVYLGNSLGAVPILTK